MATFVANVGVNAAHTAHSPLFADGSFRLLPIPERVAWSPPMLRLGDLPDLAPYAPVGWLGRAVHLDPELTPPIPTYGVNCQLARRAFSRPRHGTGVDSLML